MKLPTLAAFAAALCFLLPGPAVAQEKPEAVYAKFHRALLAGNIDDLNKYGTPEGGAELARMSPEQRREVTEMVKRMIPRSYTITSRQLSREGNRYTLTVTGTRPSPAGRKPEPQDGTIRLVKQGGVWKVDEANWGNENSSGLTALPIPSSPPPPVAGESTVPQKNAVPGR